MSNYWDLTNIEDFQKKEIFNSERWCVVFYCKDCQEIVETDRPNKNWYIFICKKCKGKNIAIWTNEWIKEKYKIKN